jgi:predicted RNase H-like nuclease
MSGETVAGVDWAGGKWLAIVLEDGVPVEYPRTEHLSSIWKSDWNFDRILIDVPIGLPHDEETLEKRETLDSIARSATGRPGSVFPAPSRGACKAAKADADYEPVAEQNQDDIGKGLSKQSYHIAAAIGEIDSFLRDNEAASEVVIESHPEVCFRGLLGEQLTHSKKTAQGIGERLKALDGHLEDPSGAFGDICRELDEESGDIDVDDVIDALALAVVASYPEEKLKFLPHNKEYQDGVGIPMRMAYWSEALLT